jgi:hypothetical protein
MLILVCRLILSTSPLLPSRQTAAPAALRLDLAQAQIHPAHARTEKMRTKGRFERSVFVIATEGYRGGIANGRW